MRKCGFCQKPNHDIRTCHQKKTFVGHFKAVNAAYRRRAQEELSAIGFGVGTLVSRRARFSDETVLSMVTRIDWDSIHCGSDGSRYSVAFEDIGPVPHPARGGRTLRLISHLFSRPMMGEIYQRKDVWERHVELGATGIKVVSPVNPSSFNPPADWISGEMLGPSSPFVDGACKNRNMQDMNWEAEHFAYYAGVLGLKESEKYFASFRY